MARIPTIPKRKPPITSAENNKLTQAKLLVQQGMAHHHQGQLEEARAFYENALKIKENHFDALQLLGALSGQSGQHEQASHFLKKALQINPLHAACHSNLGNVLRELKQFEDALASLDRAIELKPNFAQAYSNRGAILKELNRIEESLASCHQAIAIDPQFAEAYSNLGATLKDLNRIEEALENYNKAIALKPDFTQAYCNRGFAFQTLGLFEMAIADYLHTIRLAPEYAQAYWNLALCYLTVGNFQDGWSLYEWRWKAEGAGLAHVRNFPYPLWLGDAPLAGKSILLYGEQGFGDELQFYRYARLVRQLGAKVTLQLDPLLAPLFKDQEGIQVIPRLENDLPHFDYQCPLMSLPLAFNTSLECIPPIDHQMFNLTHDKISQWQERVGPKTQLRIGLAWSGNVAHNNDRNRSISLEQLITYLPDQYEYISLQKELRHSDLIPLESSRKIKHFGNFLIDFSDTAALCAQVDLIISIDTSVAHLAGTLGKTTWLLLPANSDWRWLLSRSDSPWYPSMQILRQSTLNDWSSTLEKVRAKLQGLT